MFTSRRITTLGGDKFRDESSLAFDGSDDYIDLGSQAGDLRLSGSNGAIVTWIKPVSGGDTYQRIVDKSDGATARNGYSFIIHTDAYIQGDIDENSGVTHSNTTLTYGVWSHCVWTWDGSNHYIYINGKLDDTASSSLTPPSDTTNMRIGSWNHSTAREFEGNISEVAIYNTGLTASQVKTIYNGREPYNHKEGIALGNLKAWWRMGDGTFDQKGTTDLQGGIVTDMVTPTLGDDILGGRGNFTDNSDSYWAFGNAGGGDNMEITGGACEFKASGSTNGQLKKAGILTLGQMYRLDVDITTNTGTRLIIDDDSPYVYVCDVGETGHHTIYWVPENRTLLQLYRHDSTGDAYDQNVTIDNLVIRPVNGNPGYLTNMQTDSFKGDTP